MSLQVVVGGPAVWALQVVPVRQESSWIVGKHERSRSPAGAAADRGAQRAVGGIECTRSSHRCRGSDPASPTVEELWELAELLLPRTFG